MTARPKCSAAPPPPPPRGRPCIVEIEPRKLPVTPSREMKPLRWKRLLIGKDLKEGATVWDEVQEVPYDGEYMGMLVARFGKAPPIERKGSARGVIGPSTSNADSSCGTVKELHIIEGTFQRCGREGALAKLPLPCDVAKALQNFDEEFLLKCALQKESEKGQLRVLEPQLNELLRLVRDNACPTSAQKERLERVLDENPDQPLGNIEQFMWEVSSRVPAMKDRLDCWLYTTTWEEDVKAARRNLDSFNEVIKSYRSQALPHLLGLILYTGNYLNGGSNAGRADGFSLDLLKSGGIDAVRDNATGDLRRFVLRIYLDMCRKEAQVLLKDLRPAFKNVKRFLETIEGGSVRMKKQVKVSLEKSIDVAIDNINNDYKETKKKLQIVADTSPGNDEFDEAMVKMQAEFMRIRSVIDALQRQRDGAEKMFRDLLRWFHYCERESSEDFMLLWDDFFIPSACFESQPIAKVKSRLKPTFCDSGDVDVYSLGELWEVEIGGLSSKITGGSSLGTPRSARCRSISATRSSVPLEVRAISATPGLRRSATEVMVVSERSSTPQCLTAASFSGTGGSRLDHVSPASNPASFSLPSKALAAAPLSTHSVGSTSDAPVTPKSNTGDAGPLEKETSRVGATKHEVCDESGEGLGTYLRRHVASPQRGGWHSCADDTDKGLLSPKRAEKERKEVGCTGPPSNERDLYLGWSPEVQPLVSGSSGPSTPSVAAPPARQVRGRTRNNLGDGERTPMPPMASVRSTASAIKQTAIDPTGMAASFCSEIVDLSSPPHPAVGFSPLGSIHPIRTEDSAPPADDAVFEPANIRLPQDDTIDVVPDGPLLREDDAMPLRTLSPDPIGLTSLLCGSTVETGVTQGPRPRRLSASIPLAKFATGSLFALDDASDRNRPSLASASSSSSEVCIAQSSTASAPIPRRALTSLPSPIIAASAFQASGATTPGSVASGSMTPSYPIANMPPSIAASPMARSHASTGSRGRSPGGVPAAPTRRTSNFSSLPIGVVSSTSSHGVSLPLCAVNGFAVLPPSQRSRAGSLGAATSWGTPMSVTPQASPRSMVEGDEATMYAPSSRSWSNSHSRVRSPYASDLLGTLLEKGETPFRKQHRVSEASWVTAYEPGQ